MNNNIIELVSDELNEFIPSSKLTLKAMRHLSPNKMRQLFSKNKKERRSALGKLYEYVIYEKMSSLSEKTKRFHVIEKGNDVSNKFKNKPKLGQNGLYYDRGGDIVARGNGQDLGEFDIILAPSKSEVIFAEVKNSNIISKELCRLIMYKKQLLNRLLNQKVGFILISSFDIKNNNSVNSIINSKNDRFVKTASSEDFCSTIKELSEKSYSPSNTKNKNKLLSEIKTTDFNYKKIHNSCRKKVIKKILSDKPINFQQDDYFIKRLMIGKISKESMLGFLGEKAIIAKKNKLDIEKYNSQFSKIVLSLSFPDYRPTLYIKGMNERVYLKMGPVSQSTFKFERNILPITAFYNWLDIITNEISQKDLEKIMVKSLIGKKFPSRKKAGQKPKILW